MIGPQTSAVIQSLTTSSDSMGGITETWTNFCSVSGVLTRPSIKNNQSELQLEGKQTTIANYMFFMDYYPGITEKHRLVIGTRIFDILWVYNPGNANHHTELLVKETL